jgi:hypothetical protein
VTYFKKRDAVVSDGVRTHVIGQRMFGKPMKDTDVISYKQAKELAMAVLYDVEYRQWRTKQLEL